MKKFVAMLLAALMLLACTAIAEEAPVVEIEAKSEGVMTYAEYAAAEMDAEVVIECYVQATQSWWDNKITVYAADQEGAYFLYELACSEEDAAKMVPGTKIKVDIHIKRDTDILDIACNLCADTVVFPLHGDRLSFTGFECHIIITGIHRQDFRNNLIHTGKIVIQTTHKKIHIHSSTAFEVCKGVNKQSTL